MRRINDKTLLDTYIRKYGITDLFDRRDIEFELHTYEKGEILNSMHDTTEYIQFLIEGSVSIYHVQADGGISSPYILDAFGFLGDLEICGHITLPLMIEAHTDLTCVNISLHNQREKIMNDNRFLRFVSNSLAEKLAIFVRLEPTATSLEDRIIGYLTHEAQDHYFNGVESMARKVRCSRRQLQRVLKSMVERGILIKEKKGQYRLIKEV